MQGHHPGAVVAVDAVTDPVQDVVQSAFQSAGQRCSALRVLFVQSDIADRVIDMLAGAIAELHLGDPARIDTDVGPVIEEDARAMLQTHAERMEHEGRLIGRARLGTDAAHGHFFAPQAYEIDHLDQLEREVFGPILHVIRYSADGLDQVIDDINGSGYGLTLGIHSRIEETIEYIHARLKVGNTYVNRTMIGIYDRAERVAPSRLSVLVQGETAAGQIEAGMELILVERLYEKWTVERANRAMYDGASATDLIELASLPEVSRAWIKDLPG